MFSGWSQRDRCSRCGLVFVRNPGDTWAFTIIGDRLPIAAIVVLIYFGVVRSHPVLGLTVVVLFPSIAFAQSRVHSSSLVTRRRSVRSLRAHVVAIDPDGQRAQTDQHEPERDQRERPAD